MEQIEEKERERAEKEQVFKEEAYEEIKLSDDKQAQVDARKKELEAMLANMQEMESEFDDFDTNFDDELGKLLKPDLSGFNAIPKSTPSAMNLSNKLESIREQDESTDK